MRTRATDSGLEDGWRGARIGAERRDRERRAAAQAGAAIDVGEPDRPRVVIAFLVLAVVATLIEFSTHGTSPSASELSRSGGAGIGVIATGAWWKLITANFLHANLAHVFLNVFVTYLTGRWLEHVAGPWITAATITWSMVFASLGSLLVDTPIVSIGASGVAFGIIGCAVGIDPRAKTAMGMIARQLAILNVIITFVLPGISIGGHLGGMLAGILIGWACWDRRPTDDHPAGRPRVAFATALLAASFMPLAVMAVGPRALPGQAVDARGDVTAWLLGRQLAGSELSSGRSIDEASCDATRDLLAFECRIDDDTAIVTFRERDDQWTLDTR